VDAWWLQEMGSLHEEVDDQDSLFYRPCILFIKQSWCEVSADAKMLFLRTSGC
jgi:hypothetical protein